MSGRAKQTIICHAPADAGFASDAGLFLERNCPAAMSYEPIATNLLDAVERATSGDLVLVALSASSVPQTPANAWKRDRWERVLFDGPREFGTDIAFLLAGQCKFPELLRRKNFFDCRQDRVTGFRALKRHLFAGSFGGGERPVELPDHRADELPHEILERLNRRVGRSSGRAGRADA